MHIRESSRHGQGRVPEEPAPGLVSQLEGSDSERRRRGDIRAEGSPAWVHQPDRSRLHPDLSLPRLVAGYAHPADWHRPIQVRRVEPQSGHEARQEPGLLEEGQAVPGCDRVQNHSEPFDAHPGVHCRRIRHDVLRRRHDSAAQGRQSSGAQGHLRNAADQRVHQPHRQSRFPTVRQCEDSPGGRNGARLRRLHPHPR